MHIGSFRSEPVIRKAPETMPAFIRTADNDNMHAPRTVTIINKSLSRRRSMRRHLEKAFYTAVYLFTTRLTSRSGIEFSGTLRTLFIPYL